MSPRKCLKLELTPGTYDKFKEEAEFWKSKGWVRLITFCTAYPAWLGFELFQAKLFCFLLFVCFPVGCRTLCNPSTLNWLLFVQINICNCYHQPKSSRIRELTKKKIKSFPHWSKLRWFCQGFQWSQALPSESYGTFQYAEAIWLFIYLSVGKLLSSNGRSEIFTLTCQKIWQPCSVETRSLFFLLNFPVTLNMMCIKIKSLIRNLKHSWWSRVGRRQFSCRPPISAFF